MLDIGMSELIVTNFDDISPEGSSLTASDTARKNPQSGVGRDGTTPNFGNDIVGEKPRHPGLCPVEHVE